MASLTSLSHENLTKIQNALELISQEYHVRILLATEEGSRAWGLESSDSDFDIKFVYMHDPGWYLHLTEAQRDVIDKSLEDGFLDLNGWDIRKAVKMLRESNCSILSWLQADFHYVRNDAFIAEAKALGYKYISWKSVAFHFVNKAKKHMREYFDGQRWKDEIIEKKYFFVIHPLLSALWLSTRDQPEVPPNSIFKLLDSVTLEEPVRAEILVLIERKKKGLLVKGPRNVVLDDWISQSLVEAEGYACRLPILKHPNSAEFNQLIEKYVLAV